MMAELATPQGLLVLLPLLAAILLAAARRPGPAGWANLAACGLGLGLAACLPWQRAAGAWLVVDAISVALALLTSVTALATSWFVRGMGLSGRHHALFQALLGCTLLALLANDLALMWLAILAAWLAVTLAVALPRDAVAIAAAWKLAMLGGAALALALFGLLALQAGGPAPGWTDLAGARLAPPLLNLGFALLLAGGAALVGLAPLHAWLADTQTRARLPHAVLAGGLATIGLAILLRLHGLMLGHAGAIPPGPPILALGALSMALAAVALSRQPGPRSLLATASLFHHGVVALAIGLGRPSLAVLHLVLHGLARGAALLAAEGPGLRLAFAAGLLALAGLPPFGLFASLFLLLAALARQAPLLLPVVLPALAGLVWALLRGMTQDLAAQDWAAQGRAAPRRPPAPPTAAAPCWLLLALTALLGFAMPPGAAALLADLGAGLPTALGAGLR